MVIFFTTLAFKNHHKNFEFELKWKESPFVRKMTDGYAQFELPYC